mgnify:CR=1 FL=1|jgi:IclR family KDG regulon transcriptional repressor
MRVQTKTIQSVNRALELLEAIAELGRPVRLKELSERCNLNMATCYHILNTLVKRGWIVINPLTKEYRLGLTVLRFSEAILNDLTINNRLRDYLSELAEKTGTTVNLVMFEEDQAILVDQVRSAQSRTHWIVESIGRKIPLHCTAVGKVYLASLSDEGAKTVLARVGMRRFTRRTITSIDDIILELERVRKMGYAVNNEEREEGVRCIAAPLNAQSGRIVAAISLSGSVYQFKEDDINLFTSELVRLTHELNTQLGVFFDSMYFGLR